jgi:hypothetical protein
VFWLCNLGLRSILYPIALTIVHLSGTPILSLHNINFAFACIDLVSFAICPADSVNVDLYTRATDLKKKDPKLKVFITIGDGLLTTQD